MDSQDASLNLEDDSVQADVLVVVSISSNQDNIRTKKEGNIVN